MFILESKPKSAEAEAYRSLRTNIKYSPSDRAIKSIVVTSARPQEGKSLISGNLALAFAENGESVILVDCDLRKPSIYKMFELSDSYDISDVLLKNEKLEGVIQKYNEKLDILPSVKIPLNPSEMLGSLNMRNLLEFLKIKYDIVIIDTPPLEVVIDAQVLSTRVDGTILVVRADQSKNDSVMGAKKLLEKVGANVVGTVLNGVNKGKNKYSYYYDDRKEN